MFKALWRRGRQVRKSRVASAVIPVVEALDPRKLLSAEGHVVEPLGDASWCMVGDRVLHVPASDDVAMQWHYFDPNDGERPFVTEPPVETEPETVSAPGSASPWTGPVGPEGGIRADWLVMWLYGSPGDDNLRVEAVPDGVRVYGVHGVEDGTMIPGIGWIEVHSDDGDDTIDIDLANSTIDGPVRVFGGDGTDTLRVTGKRIYPMAHEMTGTEHVFVDGTPVLGLFGEMPASASKETGGVVIRDGQMRVYGTDGDDVITVVSGPGKNEVQVSGVPGVPDGTVFSGITWVYVEAGAGDDVVTLDWGDVSLGWINGSASGEAGNDTLRAINGTQAALIGGEGDDAYLLPLIYSNIGVVDDAGESTVETYDFSGGRLPRAGGPGGTYGGISRLVDHALFVYGTPGNDNYRIEAVPGGVRIYGFRGVEDGMFVPAITHISVEPGDGDDTVVIDTTDSPSSLNIRVVGGDGIDTVRVLGANASFHPWSLTSVELYEGPEAGAVPAVPTPVDTLAAAETGLTAVLSRKAVAAKKAVLTRKQKLLAKQKKLKQLKLKQAKLAARKAALAEKCAEAREGGRSA